MEKLIQFAYASRSTFPLTNDSEALHPEVARILRTSRRNNRARKLAGALYFGDGNFFQCLEGNEDDVLALYETLKRDPRHKDLLVLRKVEISERSFAGWDMKYIPAESEVQKMLRSFGMLRFDPYCFGEASTERMIEVLHARPQPAEDTRPAAEPPAAAPATAASGIWKFGTVAFATLFFAELLWLAIKSK